MAEIKIKGKIKKNEKLTNSSILHILLRNRELNSKKEIESFLDPKLETLTPKNLDMSNRDIKKAKKRLDIAKEKKEQIIVFGDYDVDGITGTAILWEVLNKNGFKVMPYIPERIDEGYGLSIKGVENLQKKYPEIKLIITVDNGIVANEAVEYANSLGIDVIITDHHVMSGDLPKAHAIIHSVKICGSAVAYVFANELFKLPKNYLELSAMATVSDVMPLTAYNRTILVHGLKELHKTERLGLKKLIEVSAIEKERIGVYELGNVIGPRINAMGRIGSGMDSLRLICTSDPKRATSLAGLLNNTNLKRQQMTFDSTDHARKLSSNKKKIIVIADESYNQGIVGLIAGRITEEFYKPSVVIAKEKEFSKGSARSIKGVSIVKLLRELKDLLVNVGGHPGAAGFTIETKNIPEFKRRLEQLADKNIDDKLMVRKINVDLELPLEFVTYDLHREIQKLSPFGFGNPEPIFMSKNLKVVDKRLVGKENKHVKLTLANNSGKKIHGIWFNHDKKVNTETNMLINAVYSLSLNEWNGNKKIELKIKLIWS